MTAAVSFRLAKPIVYPIVYGSLAAVGLLLLYFTILSLANSPSHAIEQFFGMWYWLALLVVGFGVQVGLFVYAREARAGASVAAMAGSGGVSGVSMVACCAHHLADILPIVGLSAAAIFLVRYQLPLILIGIFSNIVGTFVLLSTMQKHGLYHADSMMFGRLFRVDMKKMAYAAGVSGMIVVSAMTYAVWGKI